MFLTRDACPCCGKAPDAELYRRSFHAPEVAACLRQLFPRPSLLQGQLPLDFVILECRTCEFLWHRHILDDAATTRLYEDGIDHAVVLAKAEQAGQERRMQLLASVLAALAFFPGRPPHELRALDFGMGYGGWLRLALALGLDAEGLEIAPRKLAHVRAFGGRALESLNAAQGPYHVIHANQVLEHVASPRQVLEALTARLAPDGALLLSVPDAGPELEALRGGTWTPRRGGIHPVDHVNGFTYAGWMRLLESAGLVHASPVGERVLLDGGTRLVLDQSSLDNMPQVFLAAATTREGHK